MPTKVPKSQPSELVPEGNHIARVYSVIHIGTIESEYMGQSRELNKVRIGFELPNKKKVFKEGEEPKPFVISEEYTLSLGDKSNLKPIVTGIMGPVNLDDFFIEDLLGHACMLYIVHKKSNSGNDFAKIQSATPLPEGIEAPAPVNPASVLNYEEAWDPEKFEKLPQFIKDKMMGSKEYKKKMGIEQEISPEDIPF